MKRILFLSRIREGRFTGYRSSVDKVRQHLREAYGGKEPLTRLNEAQRDYVEADANLALARIRLRQAWTDLRAASNDCEVIAASGGEWDIAGHKTQITYSDGTYMRWRYDEAGRMTAVGCALLAPLKPLRAAEAY